MMNIDAVKEVSASFRVMGSELIPEEITELLEAEPDLCHRKGDLRRGGEGQSRFTEGLWSVKSSVAPSSSLELHIASLLKFAESRRERIKRLQASKFRMDIFVGVFTQDSVLGVAISPSLAAKLAALELELGLDIYLVADG